MTIKAEGVKLFVIHPDELTVMGKANYKTNRKHCFSQGHTEAEKCHKNLDCFE